MHSPIWGAPPNIGPERSSGVDVDPWLIHNVNDLCAGGLPVFMHPGDDLSAVSETVMALQGGDRDQHYVAHAIADDLNNGLIAHIYLPVQMLFRKHHAQSG